MARGERTAQGSCFQAAGLGLAMGIYRSQKRRGKKGSGHSVAGHVCFLEKIPTQTTVCIVIPTPGGGNSLKWGTGVSRGQAGGELHTALCTVLSNPSPKSWVSCVWVGLLGWCVVFFCHSDKGCSAR